MSIIVGLTSKAAGEVYLQRQAGNVQCHQGHLSGSADRACLNMSDSVIGRSSSQE